MRFSRIDIGPGEDVFAPELKAALGAPEIRLLLNRLPDGVVAIDRDGTILAMNGAAASINGVAAAELIGQPLARLKERSAIDWTPISDSFFARRKGEFLGQTEDGRRMLSSLRQIWGESGAVELTLVVQRDLQVLDHARRSAAGGERRNLFKFLSDREAGPDFVKQRRLSPALNRVLEQGEKALRENRHILLVGESGTGKAEIAHHLHRLVDRQAGPFITVNCGAIPENQFEAEMFGHEKGGLPAAPRGGRAGLVEAAEGGTLFLDAIDEMPLANQVRLRLFLDDGPVRPLDTRKPQPIKTRIIAAAHRDLRALSEEGSFRRDLYYRLAAVTLPLAPLRLQPALTEHLIDRFLAAVNQAREPKLRLSAACRATLLAYRFPGNIRELHNIMQQLAVTAGEEATVDHLPPLASDPPIERASSRRAAARGLAGKLARSGRLKDSVRAFERELIAEAIARHGSKRKAAQALGVDIGTIVRKTQGGSTD
ncbi:MAG TPA: sigma 54-interacting transcriptional regulator [Hypericibacter adhaerens]|uniref:sigma 54-interacting transcriptional regulator n=1 Tax=Hypericibacter adhaerens TaxID=2602016 RepID=UPI002C7D6DA3|nr:sigma 54-interacting transcriptional regulator [Hypericibacter adhaerens]HWA43949.1 sigma 54-interacting transcriptional regulator [Hypericibacter adhaerens]